MISILIVSLIVFGVTRWTKYQKAQEQATKDEQIIEYNKQFNAYDKQVVTGFEMISLGNLLIDTNRRYSDADGFKKVSATVKLKSGYTFLGALPTPSNTYDLQQVMEVNYENAPSDMKKAFKKYYFKCTGVEYCNVEEDGAANAGRIKKLNFEQIERKN